MSDVTLNTASGSITLTPTNSSGNKILSLPAVSGTVLTTASTDTANNLNAGLGVNQTWQSPSRAMNTTYYNTTGKPIFISVYCGYTSLTGYVNGSAVVYSNNSANSTNNTIYFIVPNGLSYSANSSGGIVAWTELR